MNKLLCEHNMTGYFLSGAALCTHNYLVTVKLLSFEAKRWFSETLQWGYTACNRSIICEWNRRIVVLQLSCVATCDSCKHACIACDWNAELVKLRECTVLCQLRVMLLKKLFTAWGSRSSKMTSKKKICPCWHAQLDTILPLGCVCPYSEPQLLASLGRPKWDISYFFDQTLLLSSRSSLLL